MDKKELEILFSFRRNARKNLTKVSREIGMPVSTVFDKIKKYENGLIKKYTTLLDFQKLGYNVRVNLLVVVDKARKEEAADFLMKNQNINSLFRVGSSFDFFIEALFRDMKDYTDFIDEIEKKGVVQKQEFFVLDDLRQECFMSEKEHLRLLA